jgi:homocysteine S-methyltransferase
MTTPTFTDALADRVLVCDGAMGTMLYAKGIFLNRSFDELNLTSRTSSPTCTRPTSGRAPT